MSYKLIIKHAPIIENGARSGISMNSVIGVTYYNPGSNYPIHIGTYGWVPAINCK